MGNNHDKYFGKDKRKILILGLQSSGKSSLLDSIVSGKQSDLRTQRTKDLNIKDAKIDNLSVTFFEVAGGERQRIFWKQYYQGTQGIIFVIDSTYNQDNLNVSIEQLQKFQKYENLKSIPIAICVNKSDISEDSAQNMYSILKQKTEKLSLNKQIFLTNLKAIKSIKQMIKWVLKQSKPL